MLTFCLSVRCKQRKTQVKLAQQNGIFDWFQAPVAVSMRWALFWDFTQRKMVVFFTDVSVQPICPIFEWQAVQDLDCFILEYWNDRLFRNVGKKLPIYAVQNPKRAQMVILPSYVRTYNNYGAFTSDLQLVISNNATLIEKAYWT
jgi:hypothetical protein